MNHSFEFVIEHPDDSSKDESITGEISVTSWGSSPSWHDPGDPVEWDIEEIYLNGVLVPYWLDREAKLVNPEWERLEPHVTKYMENDFDWSDAQAAAAEDYYDYRNEY